MRSQRGIKSMLLLLLWLLQLLSQFVDVDGLSPQPQPPPVKHPIKTVCVIGGTHGNEYTGVWCIKAMQQDLARLRLATDYPSLQISTLLANPAAHAANRRFMDTDLNREFSVDDLYAAEPSALLEATLARKLDQLLGPKSAETPHTDVAVDLHSTTSNMGTTLIFPEGDPLIAQAAAWIAYHMPPEAAVHILVEPLPPREYRPNLSSCATHDFTIEVGYVPQGVVRHDAVRNTQRALSGLLEFLEQRNRQPDKMEQWLRDAYPAARVPCFHTAQDNTDDGAMTGRIDWPTDADNENFPSYMIHESVQDADYQALRKGDPLFVRPDGTIVPYDGSHGDVVHLMFVNEAGYYYTSSGTGIGVAYPGVFDYSTGMLVHEDESEVSVDGVPGSTTTSSVE